MQATSATRSTEPHGFTTAIEESLAGLLIRDVSFATSVLPLVHPSDFGSGDGGMFLSKSVEWMQAYMDLRLDTLTLPRVVYDHWTETYVSQQPPSQQVAYRRGMERVGFALFDKPIEAEGYVKGVSFEWLQRQRYQSLIQDANAWLGAGRNFESFGFDAKVRDVQAISAITHDDTLTYGVDIDSELERALVAPTRDVLRSGFTKIDEYLKGGMAKQELWIILAPANRGKSTVCCALGAAYLEEGRVVYHYTLEQSAEQIWDKYLAALSGYHPDELRKHPDVMRRWMEHSVRAGDTVTLKRFPTGGATLQDIRSHIDVQISKGAPSPDVIIIDYPDLLRPRNNTAELRHALTEIYTEARGLAVEKDALVIAPSQANRTAASREIIHMEDLAEAYSKAAIADGMFSLCQTETDAKNNIMKLFIAKNRVGKRFVTIPFELSHELVQMVEHEPQQRIAGVGNMAPMNTTVVNGMTVDMATGEVLGQSQDFLNHYGVAQ